MTFDLSQGGRLEVPRQATPTKYAAFKELYETARWGTSSVDRKVAEYKLMESVSTSDAVYSLAAAVNVGALAEFDEAPRKWREIASTQTVQDFKNFRLWNFDWDLSGLDQAGEQPEGILPTIPEGGVYPYVFGLEIQEFQAKLEKQGVKFGLTFEKTINGDIVDFIAQMPAQLTKLALDTEDYTVFSTLFKGLTDATQVKGGTIPDGTIVAPNAPLSRAALQRALIEIAERRVNGRAVVTNGGYKLLVPVGRAPFVQFIFNQTLVQLKTSANGTEFVNSYNGGDPLANITIVESERVPNDGSWYLLPTPGTERRPGLRYLQLQNRTAPELLVNASPGNYVGGGTVSPFEGNFDNDSIDFKLRMFGKGLLAFQDSIIWSDGTGNA